MNAADKATQLLVDFKLTAAAEELVPRLHQANLDDALPTIATVLEIEQQARHARRVDRLRRSSKLPGEKTFESFEDARVPANVRRHLRDLAEGTFLDTATNILAFGLPGAGKSHALCAVGHELVQAGHSVLFAPTYSMVQALLAAKRDLDLPRTLRKLDNYELIILDDIGYVKQSTEEAEVLFTLLAERYERRSTAITSNLVFNEWDRIFKNKMATSAAIDRLVHHSVILEFDVASYRTEKAKSRKANVA